MKRIELGCGANTKWKPGFEGVDRKDYGQKHIFNLEKDWEFEDNSVDEVFSSHCLEHIKHINWFMSELYRVCKKDAIISIFVPYYKWGGAFVDPSHVRFFTEGTFNYFNKEYAKQVDYDMGYDYDFEIIHIEIINQGREIKCQMKPRK